MGGQPAERPSMDFNIHTLLYSSQATPIARWTNADRGDAKLDRAIDTTHQITRGLIPFKNTRPLSLKVTVFIRPSFSVITKISDSKLST